MFKFRQLSSAILLTGAVSILTTKTAWANVVEIIDIEIKLINNGVEVIYQTTNGEIIKEEQIIKSQKNNTPLTTDTQDGKITNPITYSVIITNAKLKNNRILENIPKPNSNNLNYVLLEKDLIGENKNNIKMEFHYASNKTSSTNTTQLNPPEIKITQSKSENNQLAVNKPDKKSDSSSETMLILGNWLAENRSIQPKGFSFEENNKLIVVYQSSSGAFTVEGKYNIGQKIDSVTSIDLIINDRIIETIFQIVDGNVLSMELMGLNKGENRPTKITPKRERKFKKVDDIRRLISE